MNKKTQSRTKDFEVLLRPKTIFNNELKSLTKRWKRNQHLNPALGCLYETLYQVKVCMAKLSSIWRHINDENWPQKHQQIGQSNCKQGISKMLLLLQKKRIEKSAIGITSNCDTISDWHRNVAVKHERRRVTIQWFISITRNYQPIRTNMPIAFSSSFFATLWWIACMLRNTFERGWFTLLGNLFVLSENIR